MKNFRSFNRLRCHGVFFQECLPRNVVFAEEMMLSGEVIDLTGIARPDR